MVDTYGRWTPETDYSTYPKEKWCDMDRAYQIVLESGYEVQADVDWVLEYAIGSFLEDEDFNPKYNDNRMINVEMLREYMEASGGLKEFDIEC